MDVVKFTNLKCPRCGFDLDHPSGKLDFTTPTRRTRGEETRANFVCPGCDRPLSVVVEPVDGGGEFAFEAEIVRPQF